jgi:hypothetical protein
MQDRTATECRQAGCKPFTSTYQARRFLYLVSERKTPLISHLNKGAQEISSSTSLFLVSLVQRSAFAFALK